MRFRIEFLDAILRSRTVADLPAGHPGIVIRIFLKHSPFTLQVDPETDWKKKDLFFDLRRSGAAGNFLSGSIRLCEKDLHHLAWNYTGASVFESAPRSLPAD